MSLASFIAAPAPRTDELDAYTDALHAKYGGRVGRAMDDATWAATSTEEAAEYRRLERLAYDELEHLKAIHRS
jgi:hypothetical protein